MAPPPGRWRRDQIRGFQFKITGRKHRCSCKWLPQGCESNRRSKTAPFPLHEPGRIHIDTSPSMLHRIIYPAWHSLHKIPASLAWARSQPATPYSAARSWSMVVFNTVIFTRFISFLLSHPCGVPIPPGAAGLCNRPSRKKRKAPTPGRENRWPGAAGPPLDGSIRIGRSAPQGIGC